MIPAGDIKKGARHVQKHGTLAFLAAMAMLLGGLRAGEQNHAPLVHAAQSWDVQVGGDPQAPGVTAINFYPNTLTINAGDSISFSFPAQEPHTVTFDAGKVPGLFLTGITPNSPNPGDLDLTVAFSPVNSDGTKASYDGSQAVSSGVPTDPPGERSPFVVSFPKAGIYYFECALHGPLMSGDIAVLPAGATLPETPAAAKSRAGAELARNLTNTMVEGQAFAITPGAIPGPAGSTIHTFSAGAPGDHLSVNQFVPGDLTIKRGDYITWSQPDPNQFHTVTFLSGGTGPAFLQIIPQPGGAPKIIIPALVNAPSGGSTYTGSGLLNSGTLTPGNSVTLKIDAPPGTYEYICLFHADDYNMKGTITVTQ